MNGTITAINGKIGGWDINETKLTSGTSGMGSDSETYAFWAGGTNFTVTHTGKLKANDADIEGKITATSGKIGDLDLIDGSLYYQTSSMSSTNAGIYLGKDGFRQYSNSNAYVNIQDGVIEAKGADIDGNITATNLTATTSGQISIFNFDSSGMWVDFVTSDTLTDYMLSKDMFALSAFDSSNNKMAYIYADVYVPEKSRLYLDSYGYIYSRSREFRYDIYNSDNTYSRVLTINQDGISTTYDLFATGEVSLGDRDAASKIFLSNVAVITTDDNFRPQTDDKANLGENGKKWKQVYATKGTIETSDRNAKKNIFKLTDIHKQFFMELIPVSFMFNKANSDRTHIGFIAQDVENAMKKCGLSDLDFAGFCKDIKTEYVLEKGVETDRTSIVCDENGD